MYDIKGRWLVLAGVFLLMACAPGVQTEKASLKRTLGIIPWPQRLELREGHFDVTSETKLVYGDPAEEVEPLARDFAEFLAVPMGFALTVEALAEVRSSGEGAEGEAGGIMLTLGGDADLLGPEGYALDVGPDRIVLSASAPAGLFYGLQTLRQLLPPEIERAAPSDPAPDWRIPCVSITDRPRFKWRGMMLDVSRHFFPKEFIYRWIDHLAMYKLNTFHWHLTDDQGWRIEIEKYPRLTEVGAWRVDREDRHWNDRESQREGEVATYGGFYTQDEIRDIVAYARSRFITIVPEVEMPGHTTGALAAYPEFSCTGGPFTVLPGGYWPISDIYCAGNDGTFAFLEDILTEVIDLFPGTYIHIGGDEADKEEWRKCPKCQARIKREGLKDEEELQSYFIKRIERFLLAKGKRLIGWDEILEGGLAPEATVMSWRGMGGGIAAAKERHDVVMTPTSHSYFDYYQGLAEFEPLAIGGNLPLRTVYAFEPIPDALIGEEASHILGGQANLWTEYVPDPGHAEYMIFPRMAALSEVVWSPRESRNWEEFVSRIPAQFLRYEAAGIRYARSSFQVRVMPEFMPAEKALAVTLATEISSADVRYTIDGKVPAADSKRYRKPLLLKKTAVLKAASFDEGHQVSPVTELVFEPHLALAEGPVLTVPYKERYSGGGPLGLVDGLFGSTNLWDGRWQGFEGTDIEAVVDLGRVRSLTEISVRFLEKETAWIFLPAAVEFSVSLDGEDFQGVFSETNQPPVQKTDAEIQKMRIDLSQTKARYVRVRAKNIGICPEWHRGAGGQAWLFIDEIVIK